MKKETNRIERRTSRLAALALAALAGWAWPAPAQAAADVDSIVADWPADSQLAAKALVERYGAPRRYDADSLTWYGPDAWKRTVLHRSDADGNILEQAVDYRVPEEKIADLRSFDDRVRVDRKNGELSVRSESLSTNILLANLAHEVASDFKTTEQARRFYQDQMDLAAAGKSSSYRSVLRFEQPARRPPEPWSESGAWAAPVGKPWDVRGTPWTVPAGSSLSPRDAPQP